MTQKEFIDKISYSYAPRWMDFVVWFNDNKEYGHIDLFGDQFGFLDLAFDYQLGVFLSYMKSKEYNVQIYFSGICQYIKSHSIGSGSVSQTFNTPQEMILHFFNN